MAAKASTRDRLIGAARELFLRQGYAATGLSQVVEAAGCNPGSLYHFFPTKEDLLAAVLERYLELLQPEVLAPAFGRVDDPVERVFAVLDGYRQMLKLTKFRLGCPIGNLALELTNEHPRTRKLLADNFEQWRRAVADCFRAAAARLPPGTDADGLATFVLTTMEGAVMLARTFRSLEPYDQAVTVLRDYVDRLVAAETVWPAKRRPPKRTRRTP